MRVADRAGPSYTDFAYAKGEFIEPSFKCYVQILIVLLGNLLKTSLRDVHVSVSVAAVQATKLQLLTRRVRLLA